jgi:UDP-glucose 4-epimerase
MNILITGVAGLIGSNFADWLIENDKADNVVGVDDLSGGYIDNVNEEVIFHKENLIEDNLNYIFERYKFDLVYHFAAYAAEGLSPFMRVFNYKNNLIATTRLITLSIKYNIKRFIFTSSMATYGRGKPPFDENDILQPIDPYGIAKFACEMDLRVANEQHGLDFCIIKPHNVYGPKQNIWDKYRNVLGIWINQHLNGKPISIFGSGDQRRAFSYIGDCVEPLWNAGTKDTASKQTINLGGTKDISINEAADTLIEVMGGGSKVTLTARHEVKHAWSTWDKSIKLLEYKEKHTLNEGLSIMWDWAKKQPKRTQQIWESYELDKGMYDFWR